MNTNTRTFQSNPTISSNLYECSLVQECNDERFGPLHIVRTNGSSIPVLVKERFETYPIEKLAEIAFRKSILNSSFLSIYDSNYDPKSKTIKIYFEHFTQDLSQQIGKNVRDGTYFSEEELYAILYAGINGLGDLELVDKSHGCVAPSYLFRMSRKEYKIYDNFIIMEPRSLYQYARQGQFVKYLAPELIDDLLRKAKTPQNYNQYKADMFSLGMCILDAALVNIEGDFINRESKTFNKGKLEKSIAKCRQIYSEGLCNILSDLLCVDVEKRPSAQSFRMKLRSEYNTAKYKNSNEQSSNVLRASLKNPMITKEELSITGSSQFNTPKKVQKAKNDTSNVSTPNKDYPYKISAPRDSEDRDERTTNAGFTSPKKNQLYKKFDMAAVQISPTVKYDLVLSNYVKKHLENKSSRGSISEDKNTDDLFRTTLRKRNNSQQFDSFGKDNEIQIQTNKFLSPGQLTERNRESKPDNFYASQDASGPLYSRTFQKSPQYEGFLSARSTINYQNYSEETALNQILRKTLERSKKNLQLVENEIEKIKIVN